MNNPTQALAVRDGSVPAESQALIHMIERVARDVSFPIERLEKLMEMHERVTIRNAQIAWNDAMAAAQAGMRTVALDSSNPQTRSRYASYPALDRAVRPIYSSHGFALTFDTGEGAPENFVRVICDVLCHGHSRRYHVDMPADGMGAKGNAAMTRTHAMGSALTYGQRYLLKMIFNLSTGDSVDADDDGNAAGRKEPSSGADALTGSLRASYLLECREHIRKATDGKTLAEWWKSPQSVEARKDFELTSDEIKPLRDFVVARCRELGISA